MLTHVASIPLSTRTLVFVSDLLRARRRQLGSPVAAAGPGRQTLLVPAHLRNGDTCTRLAAGPGIGVPTVYRRPREASTCLLRSRLP